MRSVIQPEVGSNYCRYMHTFWAQPTAERRIVFLLPAVSRSLTGHRSNCLTLEFHPFGPFLATGSLDTNVKVWDLRRKDAITTFKGHTKGVKKLAISPDGKWVCSGSESGELKVSSLWT